MYDLIPPYGMLQDVVPGDPWQPESAARYNAVNELLRQERSPAASQFRPPGESELLLWVCNSSDKLLPIHSPVQIDSSFVPDSSCRLTRKSLYAFGKPMENLYGFWGIAQENIAPGQAGPVQVGGLALIEDACGFYEKNYTTVDESVYKVRNTFIFPGLDGKFHFGRRGSAEVIWHCAANNRTLVRLGAPCREYTGMFAVLENGDGTLTVKGGETDLYEPDIAYLSYRPGVSIGDTILPVEGNQYYGRTVVLVATLDKHSYWHLSVALTEANRSDLYIPGEQIFWELARYASVSKEGYLQDFQQLHQGGIVNFKERFYIQ